MTSPPRSNVYDASERSAWGLLHAEPRRVPTGLHASERPLTPEVAWARVDDWLACDVTWSPEPGPRYAELLGQLIVGYGIRGNLMPDTQLAALAAEHGLTIYSADTDFARFAEVRWENPLAA
jgi:hypothetical protein